MATSSASASVLRSDPPVVPGRRARRPPLSQDQERELAQRMEAGREAQEELTSRRVRGKRRSELQALVHDAADARTELITKNLPLVGTLALTYQHTGVELADLIGDGREGLIKAVDAFDWRFGVPFSAHARTWIKQAIERNGMTHASLVRLPVDALYDRHRIDLAKERLARELGREPSLAEIAVATDLRERRVSEITTAPRTMVNVGSGEDDVLSDPRLASGDDPAESGVDADLLGREEEAFNLFTHDERRVLCARLGVMTGEPMSVRDAAEVLGMSPRAVHSLQESAVAKSRHPRWIIQSPHPG